MPAAWSASRVCTNSAPRGTATFNGPSTLARPIPATSTVISSLRGFLLHLRDVDALQVQGEARRRQIEAEPLQEVVVASATAQHVAQGRVVDLEDGAAVVAQIAKQAEVDLHAVSDPSLFQRRDGLT